ncbi:hypothetical protein TNCV_978401 [Trichonephila clavipes]|nr:hypothetical protein TNCV_978401 [Trichonephila clavipes]
MSSSPVPPKTRRVGDRCCEICRELKRPPVGVVVRRAGCQLRCRPLHLTMGEAHENDGGKKLEYVCHFDSCHEHHAANTSSWLLSTPELRKNTPGISQQPFRRTFGWTNI